MRNRVFFCFVVVLALSLAGGLTACKTAGSKPASSSETSAAPAPAPDAPNQAAPTKDSDSVQDLAKRMFVLKDGRDMLLTIIRMARQGGVEEQLQAYAREMTMADFESYVDKNSAAKRLVYVGNGGFRLDVLEFVLDSEHFSQAQMFLQLKGFEVEGHNIESVILEKVVLDGKDFSNFASLKIYRGVLELMAQR